MKNVLYAGLLALFLIPSAYAEYDDDDDFNGGSTTVDVRVVDRSRTTLRNGGDAEATAINGKNKQELALQQDIDLTENSLVTVAPALSANGVSCDMESDSFSLLIFSKGKSRCTELSKMWNNVEKFGTYATALGFNKEAHNEVVRALMCQAKEMRKALKATGFSCRAAMKSPAYRDALLDTNTTAFEVRDIH